MAGRGYRHDRGLGAAALRLVAAAALLALCAGAGWMQSHPAERGPQMIRTTSEVAGDCSRSTLTGSGGGCGGLSVGKVAFTSAMR
ncbi:hypothetical protein [Frigidibacter oleivorans]|uniref:hypothetical protein n=1 Tax=Frigidibacter oleivorans TaxID=2487129 RepID=UPI000F8EF545|nr:hypothetical protein [Frigidibacter oleivorans]